MPPRPRPQKVQDALQAAGFSNTVVELPDSAATVAEAAAAVGCDAGQIVKSLVFEARPSGRDSKAEARSRHEGRWHRGNLTVTFDTVQLGRVGNGSRRRPRRSCGG